MPRKKAHLEDYEVSLIKAMLESGDFKHHQDILAYFTRPTRSVNHARISEIEDARTGEPMSEAAKKYAAQPVASRSQVKTFLAAWPNIDPKTGLHLEDDELLLKSREAMLAAVQGFNDPTAHFKSERFIVTAVISWVYLLHYYYKQKGFDYTYRDKDGNAVKTQNGADKLFELSQCLKMKECPLDEGTKRNLKYLIGIRNEIEHQKTSQIDDAISAKLQACCLNHNRYLKDLVGEQYALDRELSLALQFSRLDANQTKQLQQEDGLPENIRTYNANFEDSLSEGEYNDPHYAYRVAIFRKLINNKNKADSVAELVEPGSQVEKDINYVIKDRERTKYLPKDIIERAHAKGYKKFNTYRHWKLWASEDAKRSDKGFGVEVAGTWYWYQSWLDFVLSYLESTGDEYKTIV